jgi:hypothetical protein
MKGEAMKKMVLLVILAFVLVGSMVKPADAIFERLCISQDGSDRCHPEDGSEPPADCGFGGGSWGRLRAELHELGVWLDKQMDMKHGGDPDAVDIE